MSTGHDPIGDPAPQDIARAVTELREAIALKTSELADRLHHRPEPGTEDWARERAEAHTPQGQARTAHWHLTKVRIQTQAGTSAVGNVRAARDHGASWESIAAAAGIPTAAEARARWARHTDHRSEDGSGRHRIERSR